MKTDTTTNSNRVDNPLLNDADHLYELSEFYEYDPLCRSPRLSWCTYRRAAELGSVKARLGMIRYPDIPLETKVEWVRQMVTEDYPGKADALNELRRLSGVNDVLLLVSDEDFERMISKDNPERGFNLYLFTSSYMSRQEEPVGDTPEWAGHLQSLLQETGSDLEPLRQRRVDRCIDETASDEGVDRSVILTRERISNHLASEDEERRFLIEQAETGREFDTWYLPEYLGDDSLVISLAVSSARNGNADATGYLAHRLLRDGVEAVPFEELHRLCREVKDRDHESLVGLMIDHGFTDAHGLFEHLSQKASEGGAEDQYLLAVCYQNGYGTEESEGATQEWAVNAAEQGHLRAMIMLDNIWEYCPIGYLKVCERMVEQNGDEEALEFVMRVYHNYMVECLGPDPYWSKRALEMYRKALEAGIDCEEELKRAQKAQEPDQWIEEVANTPGPIDVRAVLEEAGRRFDWGFCNTADYHAASPGAVFFSLAPGIYDVMNQLAESPLRKEPELVSLRALWGRADLRSDGETDGEFIPLFREAAEAGYGPAMHALYEAYLKGECVDQSLSEALGWLRRAAEAGHVEAQFELARRYENGDGVEKDLDSAVEWYSRAANQCDVNAYEAYLRLTGSGSATNTPLRYPEFRSEVRMTLQAQNPDQE